MATTKQTTRVWGAVAALLVGLASGAAWAQGEGGSGEPEDRFPGLERREGRRLRVGEGFEAEREGTGAERRARIRERVRMLRAWRLTEVIEMDETTAARLFELLDNHDEQMAAEELALAEAGLELRQLLESGEGEDARIAELLEQIIATHLRIEEAQAQLVRDAGEFLTPRQQAALMLFLPEFNAEIRELAREVRRGRQRRERRGEHAEDLAVPPDLDERAPLPDFDPRPGPDPGPMGPMGPR